MHLLLTSAGDVTSDLLVSAMPEGVLRVNWERWDEYGLELDDGGWRIWDQFAREVTDQTLGNIIWRKPVADVDRQPGEFWYGFHEFKYAVEAIMARVRLDRPGRLPIDPIRNATANKYRQLSVARRYLPTPRWLLTSEPARHDWKGDVWVTKSMMGRPIPGSEPFSRVIYTRRLAPQSLADGYAWFVQEAITAKFDLTIVYVDGRQFGFILDRAKFVGVDWRQHIGQQQIDKGWMGIDLPHGLSESIGHIMQDLGLRFGRLDLLVQDCECREPVFLEVNPNGQWAWLDPQRDNGLFDTVLRFLTTPGSSNGR